VNGQCSHYGDNAVWRLRDVLGRLESLLIAQSIRRCSFLPLRYCDREYTENEQMHEFENLRLEFIVVLFFGATRFAQFNISKNKVPKPLRTRQSVSQRSQQQ